MVKFVLQGLYVVLSVTMKEVSVIGLYAFKSRLSYVMLECVVPLWIYEYTCLIIVEIKTVKTIYRSGSWEKNVK